jgi:hypothetical protein
MKLGEFRRRTVDLPDDTELVMDTDIEFQWGEVGINFILAPVLDLPGVVMLEAGQIVNAELDLDIRYDVHIGYDPEETDE